MRKYDTDNSTASWLYEYRRGWIQPLAHTWANATCFNSFYTKRTCNSNRSVKQVGSSAPVRMLRFHPVVWKNENW